jgi:hypothetical protein
MLRLLSILPIEAAVIPFPTELTTPPVMKMYFAAGSLRRRVSISEGN